MLLEEGEVNYYGGLHCTLLHRTILTQINDKTYFIYKNILHKP